MDTNGTTDAPKLPEPTMARCWRCEERRPCRKVRALVGGDYRRAPAERRVNVCEECARYVVEHAQPGVYRHDRVSVVSARHAWGLA